MLIFQFVAFSGNASHPDYHEHREKCRTKARTREDAYEGNGKDSRDKGRKYPDIDL